MYSSHREINIKRFTRIHLVKEQWPRAFNVRHHSPSFASFLSIQLISATIIHYYIDISVYIIFATYKWFNSFAEAISAIYAIEEL